VLGRSVDDDDPTLPRPRRSFEKLQTASHAFKSLPTAAIRRDTHQIRARLAPRCACLLHPSMADHASGCSQIMMYSILFITGLTSAAAFSIPGARPVSARPMPIFMSTYGVQLAERVARLDATYIYPAVQGSRAIRCPALRRCTR
jgi:hypothetical protein